MKMMPGMEIVLTGIKRATLACTCSVLKTDYGMVFTTKKIGEQTYKVIRNA